nr:PREDICTED: poly [ADP-ribose] polymerase 14-like [Paralichthys olivaceus]
MWEIQVDRVFISLIETYLCYHVFDPKQVKMLQQDVCSVTDDIKVYREIGYSVVVGETEAVKEMIANLEKSLPTWRELPIVDKKFKLVEAELVREMSTHYPEVKIRRRSNMLVMEGVDKEVQSGATKLDELMKKVLVKRVSLPLDLIAFIKSSGAISKYETRFQQSLRNPVSLEVESDLVLSSLSSEAMDEAEAAVKRDLTVKTVKLQGAAAGTPDLGRVKEILSASKNVANCREFRVDVSFIPGGTTMMEARLVGYSENVNRLQEVLCDYQTNQAHIQQDVNLPYPELVDCLDEFFVLIGLKQTNVTTETSTSPRPRVLLSGPRCHVEEAQQALNSALSCLTSDTLVLDGPGAQKYFQAEGKISKDFIQSSCQVLIRERRGVNSPDVPINSLSISSPVPSFTPRPSLTRLSNSPVENIAANKTNLKIKIGSLEDQQVNVLVVPMLKKQLTSTKMGSDLVTKAGNTMQPKFDSAAANCIVNPGDVLQVTGPASLGCTKLFFIECLPWDGVRGQSVQALKNGLKRCLDLCVQQELSSVAFPVIGPGLVLKFPLSAAIEALTDSICHFGSSRLNGSLSTIHVVVKPGYPDSEECYHDVYRHLSLNVNQGGQVHFGPLISDLDDVTVTVGAGVRLHVVFGDITNETTDAIVNSTDFQNFPDVGVCKDILTVAGPLVTANVKAAQVMRGKFFQTEPGSFPCKAILHVNGQRDAGVIGSLVCNMILHCESSGYKSIAIPAICAGQGKMDAAVVAQAILQGVKTAASLAPLRCVTDIRLILIKIKVFLPFKEEATQVFPTDVLNRVTVPQQNNPQSSVTPNPSILRTSFKNQQSGFLFLGLSSTDIRKAMTELKQLYQSQCFTHTFTAEEVGSLSADNIMCLEKLVEMEGLLIQSDQGSMTVSGLKDGVNHVMQLINVSLHDNLRRQVRVREEEDLHTRVAWCILGSNGYWERLPKTANHNLEHNNIAGGIMDAQNNRWTVDLQRMEATGPQIRKLKRLENLPDFTLPLNWDSMAAGEVMKVVTLLTSSAEYRSVKEAFTRTAPKTIMKIERLQNVHLRRAYEAQKKRISDKNADVGGACEKLLYHGTTQDNCDAIMKTGFNRRFAGQNATSYGHGTYFAVNANYSAHPTYAKPNAVGSQLIFVARVLTGIYTEGKSEMKVPPPRDSQQPHDRYDSVVDRMNNPSMYVVFHDNQAYPDYLITFK